MARAAYDRTLVAIAPSAGGAGTMTAIAMDWSGCDRVEYIAILGTATTNGLFDMKVTDCDTSGGTYADITGAALTQVTKAAGDGKTQKIDVKINPARPFHKIVAVTTDAAFPNGVVGIGYEGSGTLPKSQNGQNVIV